ncbi:hypothetical protein B0T10DRAFT_364909, partial [Thelonectria olida]
MAQPKPPSPPFTRETAQIKVKAAQDAACTCAYDAAVGLTFWRTRDPSKVKMSYTADSLCRNRDRFIKGRDEIAEFLTDKWNREHQYKLRKELFAFNGNAIAVEFWYEFHDDDSQWWRCYGLEDWTFDEDGLMKKKRQMSSINVKIKEEERWFKDGVDVNAVQIGPQ